MSQEKYYLKETELLAHSYQIAFEKIVLLNLILNYLVICMILKICPDFQNNN